MWGMSYTASLGCYSSSCIFFASGGVEQSAENLFCVSVLVLIS